MAMFEELAQQQPNHPAAAPDCGLNASAPARPAPSEEIRGAAERADATPTDQQTLELREERLVARKELRELGDIEVRTEIEEVPGRLEVD